MQVAQNLASQVLANIFLRIVLLPLALKIGILAGFGKTYGKPLFEPINNLAGLFVKEDDEGLFETSLKLKDIIF